MVQKRSPRSTMLMVGLLAAVVVLVYTLTSNRPPRAGDAGSSRRERRAAQAAEASEAAPLRPAAPPDADFDRYAQVARLDLFSVRRQAPSPARRETLPLPPEPPRPRPEPEPRPERERGPDTSGWSYVGYITVDDKVYGIVQNESTGASEFLLVGGEFLGATVMSATREELRLRAGSRTVTLSRTNDYGLTPLHRGPARPAQERPRG